MSHRLLPRIAILLVSILFALLLLEIGLRFAGYDLNEGPEWAFHPDFGWTFDTVHSSLDSLNPSGFRHCPSSLEKPAGTKRLLVLGDSFTAGTNLPYSATYPGLLESWLNEKDSALWQVVSLSVNDWGNAQQLLALRESGLSYRPNAIVLQTFPFNDFCNNTRILAYSCSLQDAHRPYFELQNDALSLTYMQPVRAKLRNMSRLFGFLENRLDPQMGTVTDEWLAVDENPDLQRRAFFRHRAGLAGLDYEGAVWALIPEQLQPPQIRHSWETTRAILTEIAYLAKNEGVPLIPLVIPFSKTLDADWETTRKALEAPMEPTYGTDRYEEMFRELKLEPISLRRQMLRSPMLPSDYFISPTDGHLNHFGHAECASLVFQQLATKALVESDPVSTALESVSLLHFEHPAEVVLSGLTRIVGSDANRWRYSRGQLSKVSFWLERDTGIELNLRLSSELDDLSVSISMDDGAPLATTQLSKNQEWSTVLTLPAGQGRHTFNLVFKSLIEDLNNADINTCKIYTFNLDTIDLSPETP